MQLGLLCLFFAEIIISCQHVAHILTSQAILFIAGEVFLAKNKKQGLAAFLSADRNLWNRYSTCGTLNDKVYSNNPHT